VSSGAAAGDEYAQLGQFASFQASKPNSPGESQKCLKPSLRG
jgi:hypothetical protein